MTRFIRFVPLLALLPVLLAGPARAESRLPRDVVPTFESVKLWVNADQPDYRGVVRAELRAERRAESFAFHSQGNRITKLTLSGARGPIEAKRSDETDRVVRVTPAAALEAGDYTLEIEFTNDFNTKAASLYKLWTAGHAYTFTQFEADDARGAFPCWDEPSFKIPWQVTLVVPKRHLAVSNTPIESEIEAGGQRTVVFERTPPLPSYLVAFATGTFDTVSIPGLSVPGRVITIKGQSALAAEAVRTAPPILAALESYFGMKYPFRKLDLIAVPEYWYGAMENPGLVTFLDNALLLRSGEASVADRARLAEFLAHELAHMWFGDLVTMEWWDDLWLNESFASWMGDKITQEVYPEFQSELRSLEGRNRAMETDARLSTRAMRRPVTSADNLLQLADELAYDKGQSVLGMFERYLGADRFRAGVRRYLADFSRGNANAADLWYALSKAGRTGIEPAMGTFLDQPGLPVVTVERLGNDRVRLSQRRFLRYGVSEPESTFWRIPVTLKYGEGGVTRTHTVMLNKYDKVFRIEGGSTLEWLHPNADAMGYYRWSLPQADLHGLVSRAPEILTPRERLALVDDLGALLDAGLLHGDDYLRALEPMARDPQPEVVSGVVEAVRAARVSFASPATDESFARWIRRVFRPAWERLGDAPRAGEPANAATLRSEVLGILGDEGHDPLALARGESLAAKLVAGPASVDPSLADEAVRLSAIRGDRARFDDYRARFESASVPNERQRYLRALGAFRDPALADSALAYVFRGPLRPQELFAIVYGQASVLEREDLLFRWMLDHYDDFAGRIPPMFLAFMPRAASGCSLERLKAAEAFFAEPKHQAPGTDQAMAKAADRVRDCAALRAREGAAVVRYLESLPAAEAPAPAP